MDSALTPREIQDRIRAGAGVAEVAAAAGTPEDWVEPFAAPVLAERAHLVGLALASPIRTRADGSTHRTLRQLVTSRLQARGLDVDDVTWDAWRLPDRTWRLVGRHDTDDIVHEAHFTFDLRSRNSVTANADARWMVGDDPPPSPRPLAPDEENTVDLNDELALVRATREAGDDDERDADDYTEPELEQVDGLYDIVGPRQSQMDVLYDMLSGISEDSVRIYTGLSEPVVEGIGEEGDEPTIVRSVEITETVHEVVVFSADEPEQAADDPEQAADDPSEVADAPEQTTQPEPETDDAQAALVDVPEEPSEATSPRKRRNRRASIPSWDEIMLGGPTKKK